MQICMFELVVVWNCRSESHSVFRTGLDNKYLLASTLLGGLLTMALCYIPLFQNIFETVPLSLGDWIWVFGTSLVGLLVLPEIFFRNNKIIRFTWVSIYLISTMSCIHAQLSVSIASIFIQSPIMPLRCWRWGMSSPTLRYRCWRWDIGADAEISVLTVWDVASLEIHYRRHDLHVHLRNFASCTSAEKWSWSV